MNTIRPIRRVPLTLTGLVAVAVLASLAVGGGVGLLLQKLMEH